MTNKKALIVSFHVKLKKHCNIGVNFVNMSFCSDLEESLILLPFTSVCVILQNLPALLKRGDQIEIVCKLAMFLLKIHHGPIIANQALLENLQEIQKLASGKVHELRVSNVLFSY